MNGEFGVYHEGNDGRGVVPDNGGNIYDLLGWFDRTQTEEMEEYGKSGGKTMLTATGCTNQRPVYTDLGTLQPDQKTLRPEDCTSNGDKQRDDGYGSQTIFLSGVMDSGVSNEELYPYSRERCHTWPTAQFNTDDLHSNELYVDSGGVDQHQFHPFSPSIHQSHGSSGLSLISESNESLSSPTTQVTALTSIKMDVGDDEFQHISSNDGGDQKPRVIKNLSNAPTAAHHMLQSESKVESTMSTYKSGHASYVELITQAITSSPEKRMTLSEIYDWMVANVAAFKNQRYLHSSSGWKNSVRHNLSLHSRFKRVKRNGMEKPSWWTVDLSEEVKRDRTNKRPAKPARPRANSSAATLQHHGKLVRHTTVETRGSERATGDKTQSDQLSSSSGSLLQQYSTGACPHMTVSSNGVQMEMATSVNGAKEEPKCIVQSDNSASSVQKAITVTVSESGEGDGKMDVALRMLVDSVAGRMSNLVNQFRQNTLDEKPYQLLCVQTSTGRVQEVAIPMPVPIRLVVNSDKGCQTDPVAQEVTNKRTAVSFDHRLSSAAGRNSAVQTPPMFIAAQQQLLSANTPESVQTIQHGQRNEQRFMPAPSTISTPDLTSAVLPDDLAWVDVRDDFDCNIMEVLSFEMNCGGAGSTASSSAFACQ